MINTVIFDFDGVIADSVSSIFKWFQHAASVFNINLPIQSIDDLKKSFFEPFPEFYKFLGFQWDKDVNKIYEEYISYHSSHPVLLTDGIKPLIEELSALPGIKLGIVSSNVEELLFRNLRYHGMENHFDIVRGVNKKDNSPLKPDPTILLEALDSLGSDLSESVYVGDQPSDVLTVYNASQVRKNGAMRSISISTGFASREKLENCDPRADYIIDHPSELISNLQLCKN